MRTQRNFFETLLAAMTLSVFLGLLFSITAARADQDKYFDFDQIAKGNEHVVGQFFAMHQIGYDLKNFMRIASYGQAIFGTQPVRLGWLASCMNAHSGHLFVFTTKGRIVHSEETGCGGVEVVQDINGDGQKELVATSSGGGTGFGSSSKTIYFFRNEEFHDDISFRTSSYETQPLFDQIPNLGDWRAEVYTTEHQEGHLNFLDLDRDGFKERATAEYTIRYVVQGYDQARDGSGEVYAQAANFVETQFGEKLGVERSWNITWVWDPKSHRYSASSKSR